MNGISLGVQDTVFREFFIHSDCLGVRLCLKLINGLVLFFQQAFKFSYSVLTSFEFGFEQFVIFCILPHLFLGDIGSFLKIFRSELIDFCLLGFLFESIVEFEGFFTEEGNLFFKIVNTIVVFELFFLLIGPFSNLLKLIFYLPDVVLISNQELSFMPIHNSFHFLVKRINFRIKFGVGIQNLMVASLWFAGGDVFGFFLGHLF